ncbi:MAG: NAD(P)-dependent oxidoreductase, partial [Symploca sp. SIO2G7]|nr:NAD(P)-dependent oxidoreductase [Symploca sp. SIO2G7]
MNVAFIGLGTMGLPMALNLVDAGHQLVVYNRSRDRELSVTEAGAQRADSPAAAAAGADITITCVSDTPDVEAVILGTNGVIAGARPGSLVIDMSTINPTATRTIAAQLAKQQIAMLDAPVSGGSEGAKNATLSIMVGGEDGQLTKAMPVLQAMGKTITHVGPIGAGQTTKAIN